MCLRDEESCALSGGSELLQGFGANAREASQFCFFNRVKFHLQLEVICQPNIVL